MSPYGKECHIKELPTLVFTQDYHDFDTMNDIFQKVGISLTVNELGFDNNKCQYVDLVYSNEFPSDKEIEDLIAQYHIEF